MLNIAKQCSTMLVLLILKWISHFSLPKLRYNKIGVPQTTQISKLELFFSKCPSQLAFGGEQFFWEKLVMCP